MERLFFIASNCGDAANVMARGGANKPGLLAEP
jgi:hypothetical protein